MINALSITLEPVVFLVLEKYQKIVGGGYMNTKRFFIFSVLIALLSMAGGLFPANAKASAIIKAATPTPRSALKTAVFDLKSANKVPPADILNQISFTSTGGGGLCSKASAYPTPAIGKASESSQELMVYSFMGVCGWAKNEKLTGSVKFPNGRTQTIKVENEFWDNFYTGELMFRPGVNDPAGKYTLTISGKSKSVQMVVNYTTPRGAHVYKLDDNHVLVYGFSPSESINLFYYSDAGGALKGWQTYTTGTDGRLEIKTSMKIEKGDFFTVVGKKTGEIQMLFDGFFGGTEDWVMEDTIILDGEILCPNGILSRVKVGDAILAAFTDGTNLRIRNDIGFDKPEQYKVKEGTKMTVIGGPKCTSDGTTWWKIKVSEDVKGWVAEYWHGDEYLIEPAP